METQEQQTQQKLPEFKIPEGMTEVKRVTEHCAIVDVKTGKHVGKGRILFGRRHNNVLKYEVCPDIYAAIRQCFHILGRSLRKCSDFYRRNPEIYKAGEIAIMRDIALKLQDTIKLVSKPGIVPEEETIQAHRTLAQIARRIGKVRNRHKQMLVAYIEKIEALRDEKGMRTLGEILKPAMAHNEAIHRFNELDSIIEGLRNQAQSLIQIASEAEHRIKVGLVKLSELEAEADALVREIEKQEIVLGRQPVEQFLPKLRHIVARLQISRTMSGKAFLGVEPFASRANHADVKCVNKLGAYLDAWEAGDESALRTFQNAFRRAQEKLEVLARNPRSRADKRALEREYARI